MCKCKPVKASMYLSLGISIKAGGIILLPALLGIIHYCYGVKTLLVSIIVVVSWQYVLAGIFYHDFVGGETGWKFYFALSKFNQVG